MENKRLKFVGVSITIGRYQLFSRYLVTSPSTERSQAALQETAPIRADLEGRLRMGLRTGDAEMHLGE